jgi:hypothetical protein
MYDLSSVDLQPNTFNPDANSPISGMSPIARKVVASLLCIVGVQVWLIFGHGLWGSTLQPSDQPATVDDRGGGGGGLILFFVADGPPAGSADDPPDAR